MLKPFFVLLALLFFARSPQQPAAPPVAPAAPATAAPAATAAAAVAAPSIPPEAVRMVNPVRPTAESQTHAKKVYGYDCAMCHGANGNGKGDVVADLKLTLKDYSDPAALKDMTDGELFYIIKNGKGQMPGEGDRAKPDDLWNMVIMVRSFSKK
jgi:mono/diheme cytochrome c family protein